MGRVHTAALYTYIIYRAREWVNLNIGEIGGFFTIRPPLPDFKMSLIYSTVRRIKILDFKSQLRIVQYIVY